jgi:protocatechuate 3,4-dioxygenase beta subunit
MLFKNWHHGTPTRGAVVRGRVVDHTGRAVAGARVKLGRYQVDTDSSGRYAFRHVPRGDYELALVPSYLPADYAWDGRRIQLALTSFAHVTADLLVAPLNALHGRVYVDRNQNGRFDRDEGLTRVAVHLADRVTSTDENGTYSFYNLNPGRYTVRLNADKLPSDLEAVGATEQTVELADTGPVTDVEFRVVHKVKPIIFQRPER